MRNAAESSISCAQWRATARCPKAWDKIAGPELHRLDREIDRRPRSHDNDRQRIVERLNSRNHFQPFLAGSGVARVVQVHHEERVVALFQRRENTGQRCDRIHLVALRFQQNAERFEHVLLVVGD